MLVAAAFIFLSRRPSAHTEVLETSNRGCLKTHTRSEHADTCSSLGRAKNHGQCRQVCETAALHCEPCRHSDGKRAPPRSGDKPRIEPGWAVRIWVRIGCAPRSMQQGRL